MKNLPHHPDTLNFPIIPPDILERYWVAEPADNRFQSNCRLLQSIWRDDRGHAMGSYVSADGDMRPLGSRLDNRSARAGFNFLGPDIARLVRRELAFREVGALLVEDRIWSNMLSSTALLFNLFGPLKLNLEYAKFVFSELIATDIETIIDIRFETAPGRGKYSPLGDKTALDAAVEYLARDGKRGLIGVELKYTEPRPTAANTPNEKLARLAQETNMFQPSAVDQIQLTPLRQFFAEHVLCHAIMRKSRNIERGHFLLVAPNGNADMLQLAAEYGAHLRRGSSDTLPFSIISLESTIGLIAAMDPLYADALEERYLDFSPSRALIEDWQPHRLVANA